MANKKTLKFATLRDLDPTTCSLVLNCAHQIITIQLSKEDYDWLSRIRKGAFSFGLSMSEVGLEVFFSVMMKYFSGLDPNDGTIKISIIPAKADKALIKETIQNYNKSLQTKTRSDGKTTFHISLRCNILEMRKLFEQFEMDMYPDAGESSTK